MKIRSLILLAATFWLSSCSVAEQQAVTSPDGKIRVEISTDNSLRYAVYYGDKCIMRPSAIGLELEDGTILGVQGTLKRAKRTTEHRHVLAPLHRQASYDITYNTLTLQFKEQYSVEFRLSNEGVAYRFTTRRPGEMVVRNEVAEFNFAAEDQAIVAYSRGLTNAYQFPYSYCTVGTFERENAEENIAILPLAVKHEGVTALVCESDLKSYPGMFLTAGDKGLKGLYAAVPDSTYLHPRRCQEKVATRLNHIARTEGTRTFPWRILLLTEKDTTLPVSNMVYDLGEPNAIGDCAWVKPGKVAWDWWNNWGLLDTDFEPGINTATYKAYIDFAAKYGLEYVVLDEGWSTPQNGDMMQVIDDIDLEGLIAYAEERHVGLILWGVINVMNRQLEEVCAHYAAMGIKGFKLDFLDRDDQPAVEMVYRVVEACARHHLLVDLHGMYKPTGLNRTFPHIVNFEGVYGLEELKWSNPEMPEYDVTFPYLRMVQGPVDYTQGSYLNRTKEEFEIRYQQPQSQGTRAHQVAAYVVFDSPLAMLCDSPTFYEREPDCTRFIASIPTRFDCTRIVDGTLGDYIITARRSGDTWFVGGMTDWTARTVEVDLSFLNAGATYTMQLLADGAADAPATAYTITSREVTRESIITATMASGGGFAMILKKL